MGKKMVAIAELLANSVVKEDRRLMTVTITGTGHEVSGPN